MMKTNKLIFTLIITLLTTNLSNSYAADQSSSFSTGADLYSSYVWRGVRFSGPSIQPYIDYTAGGFSIGAWGSYGYDGFTESDLYASYSFDFGLSAGITDYYYPGSPYFNYSADSAGAHGFEVNLGYTISGFSISANYMLNEAGLAGTAGGDMYFEAQYSFDDVSLHLGAGDGWHSLDGDFAVVNAGISTTQNIKVTEEYTLPVTGSAIWNPDREQFHILFGLSL